MRTHTVFLSLVLLALLVAGCRSEQYHLHFQPQGPLNKELNLHISGNVKLDIPIAKVNEDFATDIVTSIRYDSTAMGNTMQFQFRQFGSDRLSEADSAKIRLTKGAENLAPFSSLSSSTFNTVVDAAGKAGKVTGVDSFVAAVNRTISKNVDNPKAVQALQVDEFLSDGVLTSIIDLTQNVLPGKAVAIGDSWQHNNVFSPGFSLRMKNKYTLERIEGDTAFISVSSGIDQPSPNESISPAGISWFLPEVQKNNNALPPTLWSTMTENMKVDVKGKMTGEIAVDRHTGILINSNLEQFIEGNIKMGSFEVPIKLNMNYNYSNQ